MSPTAPDLVSEVANEPPPIIRRIPIRGTPGSQIDNLLDREWLVTNGLGGYSSGTVGGVPTRSYHGLLIAALPAPLRRILVLGPVRAKLHMPDGNVVSLGGVEHPADRLTLQDSFYLTEFRLETGLPVWRYEINGSVIERRLWMPHCLNTVMIRYRLLEGPGPVRLELHPGVFFRFYDAPVCTPLPVPFRLALQAKRGRLLDGRAERNAQNGHVEVQGANQMPTLRMAVPDSHAVFTGEGHTLNEVFFRVEQARGYPATGAMYCPGWFTVELKQDEPATLVATCESWESLHALPTHEAEQAEHERRQRLTALVDPPLREGVGAELVLAADQFLIFPATRMEEATRLRAAGHEARTVIAGYHWFTDWGRDTMISLEGLTLATGRHAEAGYILRTFAHYIQDGLIPNFFPDGQTAGLYHTADATLWLFHALHRYLAITHDLDTLHQLLPKLADVVQHHLEGTYFGIGVDSRDGLLRQGQTGYQLTWMDAKVGDWVVTPRRGKAVEINALWYNALCLLRDWLMPDHSTAARELAPHIDRVHRSFNERFWNAGTGCLFDVVDGDSGDDPSCRPNQLFAISLPHPVLVPQRWRPVLGVVRGKLLTPVGLRSLSPDNPNYAARYDGNLRMRDAAYHQGTVWPWLLGAFVDAWLRVYPQDKAGARSWLAGLVPHLSEAGVGSISEIFDAEEPYTARGCIAQAWSVAEMLRCWAKTAP